MTDEERLDRLERITKLMVRAGLRARRQMREQTENINILIDSQIKNEEKFSALAESQTGTNERLDALISTVERFISERGNGKG